MKIKELKQLVAELPEDLDEEELWFIEVSGHDTMLVSSIDEEYGVQIVGDSQEEAL